MIAPHGVSFQMQQTIALKSSVNEWYRLHADCKQCCLVTCPDRRSWNAIQFEDLVHLQFSVAVPTTIHIRFYEIKLDVWAVMIQLKRTKIYLIWTFWSTMRLFAFCPPLHHVATKKKLIWWRIWCYFEVPTSLKPNSSADPVRDLNLQQENCTRVAIHSKFLVVVTNSVVPTEVTFYC